MSIENPLQNNILGNILRGASREVVSAIQGASAKTGVDFAYLVQQAKAESSFNPAAKAKTSSASGLYQFIESTWMDMVQKHGEKYGINVSASSRKELLDLRHDPEKASSMAAEFANENKKFLDTHWGGSVGSTELYFAHFLGAGSASAFLKAHDEDPLQPAADLFPKAAKANQTVFFDQSTGRAKTLSEVYAFFDKKFGGSKAGNASVELANNPVVETKETQVALRGEQVDVDLALRTGSLFSHEFFGGVPSSSFGFAAGRGSLGSFQNLVMNPLEVMLLAQMDLPMGQAEKNRM